MFLEEISLNFIQPCTTDTLRIRAQGIFSRDISSLFPYLNTYIKTAIYNKKSNTLTYNENHKIITIYEDKVNIVKLINETEAFELLDNIKDLINIVHNKKNEIKPSYEIKKLPSPLEIYKYLPKLNCNICDKVTCMAFAISLIKGEKSIKLCKPLNEDNNNENLRKVEDIILMLGYDL